MYMGTYKHCGFIFWKQNTHKVVGTTERTCFVYNTVRYLSRQHEIKDQFYEFPS